MSRIVFLEDIIDNLFQGTGPPLSSVDHEIMQQVKKIFTLHEFNIKEMDLIMEDFNSEAILMPFRTVQIALQAFIAICCETKKEMVRFGLKCDTNPKAIYSEERIRSNALKSGVRLTVQKIRRIISKEIKQDVTILQVPGEILKITQHLDEDFLIPDLNFRVDDSVVRVLYHKFYWKYHLKRLENEYYKMRYDYCSVRYDFIYLKKESRMCLQLAVPAILKFIEYNFRDIKDPLLDFIHRDIKVILVMLGEDETNWNKREIRLLAFILGGPWKDWSEERQEMELDSYGSESYTDDLAIQRKHIAVFIYHLLSKVYEVHEDVFHSNFVTTTAAYFFAIMDDDPRRSLVRYRRWAEKFYLDMIGARGDSNLFV